MEGKMRKEHIFVYGTLKRGCPAESLMHELGGRFLTEAHTADKFDMFVLRGAGGHFPALAINPLGAPVKGEVWEVPEWGLPVLDQYEGAPHFYQRKKIQVVGRDGKIYEPWVYLLPVPKARGLKIPPQEDGFLVWRCRP